MELHPDYTKENLDQIGKKEGLALLQEWIDSSSDAEITAIDMVRAGRLATSVRKKFVIANPLTCTYYFFECF